VVSYRHIHACTQKDSTIRRRLSNKPVSQPSAGSKSQLAS
jgi:hypothetical protein